MDRIHIEAIEKFMVKQPLSALMLKTAESSTKYSSFSCFNRSLGCSNLSKVRVLNALEEFGISNSDGIIYIYLAKRGPKKVDELAKALKTTKHQLYPSLIKLENTGLIMTDSKKTTTFTALPFDKVLECLIYVKMEKARTIQNRKAELLALWESIKAKEGV